MSDFSVDKQSRLLSLIKHELELFGQMRGIIGKQAEMIESDDLAAFNESLDRRQELIEKINGLHQEADPLMQSYVSYADSADRDSNRELETAIGQLRSIIAECAEMNDGILEAAKTKAVEYTERIARMSLSRESLGRYQHELPNPPQMFDKMT